MRIILVVLLMMAACGAARGQEVPDDSGKLHSILLDEYTELGGRKTDRLNFLDPLTIHAETFKSSLNLSDALAKIPGFAQITTSSAISKPVVRGLYGNRVLTILNGLRYDAQQWQDEHGLGISQIGISRVSWDKTGQSALYGSEAVGGRIEIEEAQADSGKKTLDATVRLHSGTLGTLTDAGFSDGTGAVLWHVRAGFDNGADYKDGSGTRVLNSRYKGYYLKAGGGFSHKKWQQYNFYSASYNQYGFILDGLSSFMAADSRGSRALSGPHHNVLLNLLSSQNTFELRNATLKINAGMQSNKRAEDEGGGEISLDVHLLTVVQNAILEKEINDALSMQLRESFSWQSNTNLGKRILIPDARMQEANVAAMIIYHTGPWMVNAALGLNYRHTTTLPTRLINVAGKETQPFTAQHPALNAALSVTYRAARNFLFTLNTSSGSRMGNLAELASDGVHEGTYNYEIGNKNLAVEQNLCTDIGFRYSYGRSPVTNGIAVTMEGNAFYNAFRNYIFLSPTSALRFGFPVYRYAQQNALLYGGELGAVLTASRSGHLFMQWKETYATVRGIARDGNNLPFIPPARLISTVLFYLPARAKIKEAYAGPELEYVRAQNNFAAFETSSPAYALLNFSGGARLGKASGRKTTDISLSIRNLLNHTYADHLSRIRQYGLNNQGINVVLSVSRKVDW